MTTHDQAKNIVVIGGGIIGCTSAYFLSRHPDFNPSRGDTITLLEASGIAGGASGKAGGLLALWAYPSSLVPLSYKLHRELAREHGGEERWGYRAVHCGSVECKGRALAGLRGKGNEGLRVAGKDGEMDGKNGDANVSLEKTKNHPKLAAAGVPKDLDWVHPDCLRAYDEMGDPSTTAQVHPLQFTTAMADLAAEKEGVEIKTNSPVKSINYTSDKSSVESVTYTSTSENNTSHTLRATDIVLAAGPWTPTLHPRAPISALRAHSVTIKPSRPVSAYALFTEIKLPANFSADPASTKSQTSRSETVAPEIYARPRNEVYACGEGDRLVPLPALTSDVAVDEQRCQDIVDQCASVSDELAQGQVTARQACYLPNVVAGSGGPLVGLTGVRGEVLAAGHTCWGIQNGPGTGKLVSEFVFGGRATSAKVQSLDPRNVL
ncbi:hypothetical protein MBLNU230_g7326t1 [Neophaeotheca triangularis]